jgi:hypothetical protein
MAGELGTGRSRCEAGGEGLGTKVEVASCWIFRDSHWCFREQGRGQSKKERAEISMVEFCSEM